MSWTNYWPQLEDTWCKFRQSLRWTCTYLYETLLTYLFDWFGTGTIIHQRHLAYSYSKARVSAWLLALAGLTSEWFVAARAAILINGLNSTWCFNFGLFLLCPSTSKQVSGLFLRSYIALVFFSNIYLISVMPNMLQYVNLIAFYYSAFEYVYLWTQTWLTFIYSIQRWFSVFKRDCLIYVNLVYIMYLTNLKQ